MLGRIFVGPLAILYYGVGLWGFFLVSQYIYYEFGWLGVIAALVLLPFAYGLVPLWAGLADGYWLPAIVCYAPFALMLLVGVVASLVESRR